MFKDIINFLRREGNLSFWRHIVIMGMLSGFGTSAMLATINLASKSVDNEELNYRLFAIFIVLFLIFYIAKKYALSKASQEIERIIKNMRSRVSHKILNSNLASIEKIDPISILTRMARETAVLSLSSIQVAHAIEALIVVIFSLIYLLILSPIAFFIFLVAFVFVAFHYLSFAKDMEEKLIQVNEKEEMFSSLLNSMLMGFKELKISSIKKEEISEDYGHIINKLNEKKRKIGDIIASDIMYGQIFLYVLLATIVFLIPHFTTETSANMVQVTAVAIFIMGPYSTIVLTVPVLTKSSLSITIIYNLEKKLDGISKEIISSEDSELIKSFEVIKLENAEFHYVDEHDATLFSVGRIDLSIKKGEILFIVGGNGSGKSTFVKMLLGLYTLNHGSLLVDDKLIDEYNTQSYRDLFTIVLTDFHLFQKPYGINHIERKEIQNLLVEMGLDKKTKFVDGKFTNIDLSTGQRKRLALILAILEDKPIYVFDEWAADQDPEFRRYFYHTILKRLKKLGKTIIAVTHDDAYFDMADRVYKMDYGKLEEWR